MLPNSLQSTEAEKQKTVLKTLLIWHTIIHSIEEKTFSNNNDLESSALCQIWRKNNISFFSLCEIKCFVYVMTASALLNVMTV